MFHLFSKHNDEAHLGVDIGAHGIKLVELHKKKGRPVLWTYGMLKQPMSIHPETFFGKSADTLLSERGLKVEQMKPGALLESGKVELYGGLLKQLVKSAKTTTPIATASLPVSHIFHAVVTLPAVEEKDIGRLAAAEVKKLLSLPIEEMQVVHQTISSDPKEIKRKDRRVLVTAAPKALVQFYTAIFEKAGLELVALETEAFAIDRALVGRDTATVLVLDVGAERTNFFIMDGGLPMTHRSIQAGGNRIRALLQERLKIDQGLAEHIMGDVARLSSADIPEDIFDRVVDPILKEIQYSFDLFLRQSGNEGKQPEKIILTGGASVFPFFLSRIQSTFSLKTFVGDPWARIVVQQGLRPLVNRIGPRMTVAIGLALRGMVSEDEKRGEGKKK